MGTNLVAVQQQDVPAVDDRWLSSTKERWADLWACDIARVWVPSDHGALYRLFDYYDELERMQAAFRAARIITVKGEVKIAPTLDAISKLDAMIARLEDRFGLSMMSRVRAGVKYAGAQKTLEDSLTEAADGDARGHRGGGPAELDEDDDPRAAVIDVRSRSAR